MENSVRYGSHEADYGFNLSLAVESARSFVESTGVGCSIIDPDGDFLFRSLPYGCDCGFCGRVRRLSRFELDCERTHLYGSAQANNFGGKYIYFCPTGLVHFVSPIRIGGEVKASLIGGPVLIVDKEEFVLHDLLEKHDIPEEYAGELMGLLADTPIYEPDKISHLSNMLFMTANFIGGVDTLELYEEDKSNRQQSAMGEYVQSAKRRGGGELTQYPLERERDLLSAIAHADKPTAQRLLNELLGHIFFCSGNNFEAIRTRVLELVVLLSRAALDGGADIDKIFGLNEQYLKEIHDKRTLEDLSFWLSKIMKRFTEYVFELNEVKHVDVIFKAINYINLNYMKKISMEEVARFVFLSPSYFSKVFKDEMKCNFNAYLNHVRIEKSKRLLLSDTDNLVDIADMVGFEDQSYFSKVFKKLTGVTPGKYREARGQIGRQNKPPIYLKYTNF